MVSLKPCSVSAGEINQQINALLGSADTVKQFQAYSQTISARSFAENVASNLYYTATPLTPQQGDQLAQLVANNLPRTGNMSPSNINWDSVLAQAPTILSASQMAVLKIEAGLGAIGVYGVVGSDAPPMIYNQAGTQK